VVQGVAANDERLHEYRNALLAEPFSLGRSLPVRFRFADHPTRPTLFMIVHHLVCDGRGMIQMIDALLGALAGKPIEPVAIDRAVHARSALAAGSDGALRAGAHRLASHAGAEGRRAWRDSLIDPLAPLSAFTAPRVLRYTPKLSVKKLVAAAKAQDTSLNALTLAAVTLVLARRARAEPTPWTRRGRRAHLRGRAPLLRAAAPQRVRQLRGQLHGALHALLRRGRAAGGRGRSAEGGRAPLQGPRARASGSCSMRSARGLGCASTRIAARRLKTRGKLAPMSAHYSTVGSVDFFARHDAGLASSRAMRPTPGCSSPA
jgi:hypothetical protein